MRSLKVGDVVMVSGRAYTGRDAVHHHLMSHEPPVDLRGSLIYHCGPVVKKLDDGTWTMTAAGPDDQHPRGAVSGRHHRPLRHPRGDGQGRHGRRRRWPALKQHGAVYLNAIGGAAQFYARCIERVDGVSLQEFGTPEAMWHLQLEGLPGDRHHGRPRQQPAQGHRAGVGGAAGRPGGAGAVTAGCCGIGL